MGKADQPIFTKVKFWHYFDVIGIGNEEIDAIGYDMALMASCDHTIISRGSFSSWCAILAGGEYYGEYGPIVPVHNIIDQQDKKFETHKNRKKRKIY